MWITETLGRLMETVDKRQAEMTAFTAKMMAARAEFYRAYESYVGVIAGEFGTYKVVDGQFIFPLQRTVDRYNVAATAMSAATKRVVALEEERTSLLAIAASPPGCNSPTANDARRQGTQ